MQAQKSSGWIGRLKSLVGMRVPKASPTQGLTAQESEHYYLYEHVPELARLELSTVCQLRCAGCDFQKGGADNLGRGFLSVENFVRFCEMNPFVREIEISNWGEPFLNPDIVDLLHIAHENGVVLRAWNGSNFNAVTDDLIQALVETEFMAITLSIDGASQETYAQYRVGGDFNQVIENVRKLQAYKRKKNSQYPKLTWQYVLMEHNELEVGKAKKLANELGIPIRFKLNWDDAYTPVNRDYLEKETGLKELTRAEYAAEHNRPFLGELCKSIFFKPQINWDGRLLGCCDARYATFDVNVFEVGLLEAIRSPKYLDAKKCLMALHPDRERYSACLCFDCNIRRQREQAGAALELE